MIATLSLLMALAPPMPASLVDPFIGTSGTQIGGPIDTFPGADVPFGMLQWSPDTPSQNAGGGYEYTDKTITGLSLTHLSGPGCNVFGDFGILPTVGDVTNPATASQSFLHASESASPGSYAVSLGDPQIGVELSVTPRTGIGRFTFPQTAAANLLFNVSSNQAGVSAAYVHVDSSTQISGSASSGFFCGMPDRYTVYFVARFDRPFSARGTWKATHVTPGSDESSGPQSGAYVTFDTTQNRIVNVKVGLSFVSTGGAARNLNAENSGWDLNAVAAGAAQSWNSLLGRIAVAGGTTEQQKMFYTALYHALLHPNVISDADGRYRGFDGAIHRVTPGHLEYANYSDWDIYRTEVPLLALVAPAETSDMMQSLVDAAQQEGWLPRWALVNGPTSVMGGDSVDPVIAGAYAFGARNFDTAGALRAMVKGASIASGRPAQGWYIERWELDDDYVGRGYVVNTHTTSVAPVPNGASETLEYALDDFSIARFARALGDRPTYQRFMQRASNWSTLFSTATGTVAGRDPDGAFMPAPITENGQSGFQEGNAAQYMWMVPQDLRDLIAGLGGNAAADAKLDAFFTNLNADQNKPYAWLGNEVSLGSPWVYLSAGEPWKTQEIVRKAITTLYAASPEGLPGNDDLGTMSAWYIWSAIGLYPQNPSVRILDIGSPLFSSVVVKSPNGPTIDIEAPNAASDAPYVQGLRVNGAASENPWLALPKKGSLRLDFDLGTAPNKQWGTAPANAPPSYADAPVKFVPSTAAALSATQTQIDLAPGSSASGAFTVASPTTERITWAARVPAGLHVDPASGDATASTTANVALKIAADASTPADLYNVVITAHSANGALLERLALAVRVARAGEIVPLAYAQNRFGNTITPVDLRTGAVGAEIEAGEEPRDAAFTPDGHKLFVADRGGNTVRVFDVSKQPNPAGAAVIKTGHAPNGIHVTPDGTTAWFANSDDGTVQPIDVKTLRAGTPISVGANPRDVAIAPDGSTLYVSNIGSNTVTPVDLKTHAAQPPIATGDRPNGLALTPDGKRLYVVDNASNDVSAIDVTTGNTFARIPVGVSPMFVAISPDGKLAYVTNYANSTITPIDLATNAARTPIVVGGAPYGIAFAKDGKTAVVVVRRDNACVTVDVATGRASKPILLGNGPYTIAIP
jgi:predicted alpha-1,2-mannosidase